jgi:Ner family transcriptional regulator
MGKTKRRSWDRHAIMAEIRRRKSSLRQLSLEAGLSPSACSKAFTQSFPAAEVAIAQFLGLTVQELWPDRYPTLPISPGENATDSSGVASLIGATVQTCATRDLSRGAA